MFVSGPNTSMHATGGEVELMKLQEENRNLRANLAALNGMFTVFETPLLRG